MTCFSGSETINAMIQTPLVRALQTDRELINLYGKLNLINPDLPESPFNNREKELSLLNRIQTRCNQIRSEYNID